MVDKDNNVITINNVRYKLAPMDLGPFQQILSRATVVKGTDTSIVKTDKLNDAVVKNLIGHTDVVYYNFETKAWNRSAYNGYPIDGQKTDTKRAHAFKAAMEREPEFRAQYEMVASVTMTIDRKFYSGWKKTISNPVYSATGPAVVGNIIVKNKATGQYELYCKSWVGVVDCILPDGAACDGATGFANSGAWHSDYRAVLIAAHTR